MRNKTALIGVMDGSWETEKAIESTSPGTSTIVVDTVEGIEAVIDMLDGVVLCGGTDINPEIYNAKPDPNVWLVDKERDTLELKAIELAREHNLPVLGICRGAQMINIAFGGTLYQHIDYFTGSAKHFGLSHGIKTAEGSTLRRLFKEQWRTVNSLHHQAVERIGEGLLPTAWSHDGIVEAIESAPWINQFVLGVQWHPEMLTDQEPMRRLFRHFVRQATVASKGKQHTSIREALADDILAEIDVRLGKWKGNTPYGWYDSSDAYFKEERKQEKISHYCSACLPGYWDGPDENGKMCDGNSKNLRTHDEDVDRGRWELLNEIADDSCAFPPCRYPGTCNPLEGDCMAEAVAEGQVKGKRGRGHGH